MKIILENEMEKWAWETMMSAHYKWEKNHGHKLQDQMDWYFEDIFNDARLEMIKKEIERRLRENWSDDYGLTEVEYVAIELAELEDVDEEEKKALVKTFKDDYKHMKEKIEEEREVLTVDVEEELRGFYYTFFNAPENLTVIYNGEVIQGKPET